MTVFYYKGFIGSAKADMEDKVLHGKLLDINDLVTYEATTMLKLEAEFKNVVDDYIQTCKQLNRKPNQETL